MISLGDYEGGDFVANYQLAVEERFQTGKSYARQLRAAQKVPAVVYGPGNAPINIEVAVREVEKAMSSQGSLIELQFGGGSKTVIVKDLQRDPVRGALQHLDFHEVDLTKKLEITIPIRVVGEGERSSDGGILATLLWEIPVLCLPTDIPDALEVDVSGLGLDETFTVADLKLPQGVEVLAEAEEAIARINLPVQAKDDEADSEEEAETEASEEADAEESAE